MHVVTGMLLAGLLGQRRGATALPLLRTGPVRAVHAMPGRVRFRVPSLSGDPASVDLLREKLPSLEGVTLVEVNAASGSVLICYREAVVQAELLFAATVRLLGLDSELTRTPAPAVVRELQHVMDSLNRVVYDRTGGLLDFSSAALILLAGFGLRSVLVDGARTMPAGYTFLWWGVNRLLGRGEE